MNFEYNNFPLDLNRSNLVLNWLETLCTGNVDKVVSLYATDGVLLGTVAESIAQGKPQIRKYFEMFTKSQPCGKITSIIEQDLGAIKVFDGTYDFNLTDPDTGVKSTVSARYTFVFQYVAGSWLIATHHSSKNP
jgi:uncharacterized protein (TIGR02246 family)